MSSLELQFSGEGDSRVRVDLRLRPHKAEVWRQLRDVRRSLPGTVRVVVLRNLMDLATCPDLAGYQQACDWTSTAAFISVAVLDSHCFGPALDLAMGCDLRIATADTVLAAPGLAATDRLVELVGYAGALELTATGRRMHGTEAYQSGLVQRLVPAGALDEEVDRLADELLATDAEELRELKALLLGCRPDRRASLLAQADAHRRLETSATTGAPEA